MKLCDVKYLNKELTISDASVNLEELDYTLKLGSKVPVDLPNHKEGAQYALFFKYNEETGSFDLSDFLDLQRLKTIPDRLEVINYYKEMAQNSLFKLALVKKIDGEFDTLEDLDMYSTSKNVIYGAYYDDNFDFFDVNRNMIFKYRKNIAKRRR